MAPSVKPNPKEVIPPAYTLMVRKTCFIEAEMMDLNI
jgi:hypothetical protein